MPKPKAGHSQVNLLLPDEVLESWRLAAANAGQSLHEWITRTCSKRSGVSYTPPQRGYPKGRPRKDAAPLP